MHGMARVLLPGDPVAGAAPAAAGAGRPPREVGSGPAGSNSLDEIFAESSSEDGPYPSPTSTAANNANEEGTPPEEGQQQQRQRREAGAATAAADAALRRLLQIMRMNLSVRDLGAVG